MAESSTQAPRVLVIAGLDPTGQAGLWADLEAISAAGARALLCCSALTAQGGGAVSGVFAAPPGAIAAQVEAVLREGPVGAAKLGMLPDEAALREVAEVARRLLPGVPLVIDPVLWASAGAPLFRGDPASAFAPLYGLAALLTPNLPEAEALSGLKIEDPAGQEQAARRLVSLGARAVLVKGGHLRGDPVDVLLAGEEVHRFSAPRIEAKGRGTGCRLASYIAARLALGAPMAQAVAQARAYLRKYLALSAPESRNSA